MAYLEKLRLDKLRQGCVVIQKHIRGWLQRKKFLRERQAALIIQQYFRGEQTVRYVGTKGAVLNCTSVFSDHLPGGGACLSPGSQGASFWDGHEPQGEKGMSLGEQVVLTLPAVPMWQRWQPGP